MGSLRNPVGPLPSTIYWRRRAVLLSVLGLLVLLVVWIVVSGGGGGKNDADGPGGNGPATSITPGPPGSGPAISEHPGGRDESSEGSGSGSGGSGGSGSGSGGAGGSGGSGGSAGAVGGGSGDDAKGGGGSGDRLSAGSRLPNCTSGDVKLKLRSIRNTYGIDEKPKFELIAQNSGDKACKVDLGGKGTVLTITQADGDDEFWSSADCPSGDGSLLLRVPSEGRVTHSVQWDRRPSAPHCATPSAGVAEPGTYLVEAKAAGLGTVRASFVLEKD
ncbi:hypothetical protein ACFVYR_24935 [Streptomyces sp. NPDC058284]|uniref:hypothetical protein n=1 Tax=unclassified Streptomyces TaxID=2593676 RepID=UPI003651C7D0